MEDSVSETLINGTVVNVYDYTPTEKAAIIWAVAFGTIAGTFPFNYCFVKFGARYTFLAAGLISAVSTSVIPMVALTSFPLLLVVRFVQGVAYSADFAVIGIICVKWAPLDENAIFVSVLTIFSPIATSITDSISGMLCTSSLGWQSAFYLHAFVGVIFFIIWAFVYSDTPTNHRFVNQKECELIQKGKSDAHFETKRTIPYLKLITNPAILCCWFNAFMDLSMSILMITYSPTYFNEVLGFPIEQTGFIISITNFAQIPFKMVSAYISDKVTIVTPLTKMLIFNTISCGIVAVLFGFVGFVPASQKWIAMGLVTAVNCLMSSNCGGYYQCARYVSQQYADVVIAAIQFCKAIALFFVPGLVAVFVHDETSRSQWAMAFCVNSGLLLVATFTSYCLFTDKPAEFTKTNENKNNNDSSENDLELKL
ncbi:unnamed protein product [Caenorhabditis angaria]|uniref:Major facilitator superfamily (MFS) profile domain-containing protein n=1 Tax=Caenorhabditis angaria TaxID=860376 RepID=A0A9P1ITG8_9PELO|nr:unnamed protein product [Caenorhabditis angaria]